MRTSFNHIDESILQAAKGYPEGAIKIDYPFANYGDTESIIVERDYIVDARYYASLPLDTPIDEETKSLVKSQYKGDLILVEQSVQSAEGGLARVTRTYATIPQPRIERCAQSVQLFGLDVPVGKWETSVCRCDLRDGYYYFSNIPAKWRGSLVYFSYPFYADWGGYATSGRVSLQAFCAADGLCRLERFNAAYCAGGILPNYLDGSWREEQSRPTRTATVDGYTRLSYQWLPSPDIKMELTQPLMPFNRYQSSTYLSNAVLSANTVPTAKEYLSMIAAHTAYQCADATVRRWLGNIYEIATPFCYAV